MTVEACDVGKVVENHVKNLAFGNYSACLQTRTHLPSEYFRDLRFLERKKLLQAQFLPGNGSMVVGNSSAPAPRGFVFLSSRSCARALS